MINVMMGHGKLITEEDGIRRNKRLKTGGRRLVFISKTVNLQ
jgi:hypothetical protein